ncbi:MAG: hypothetical protein ACPGGK_16085 [Pikeienuella sp.]
MSGSGGKTSDDKAERLAAALRANLRRRKGQQRGRDDLSGRDPNRRDTVLQQGVAESNKELRQTSDELPKNRPDTATDDAE